MKSYMWGWSKIQWNSLWKISGPFKSLFRSTSPLGHSCFQLFSKDWFVWVNDWVWMVVLTLFVWHSPTTIWHVCMFICLAVHFAPDHSHTTGKLGALQDKFIAKVKRIYERIDEFTCESNFEYMSEQDMIDAKWSENLHLCFSMFLIPTCKNPGLIWSVLLLMSDLECPKVSPLPVPARRPRVAKEKNQGCQEALRRPSWVHEVGCGLRCWANSWPHWKFDPLPEPTFIWTDRKSEYGEGTLYWVVVSHKGQRKLLVQNKKTKWSLSNQFFGCYWFIYIVIDLSLSTATKPTLASIL